MSVSFGILYVMTGSVTIGGVAAVLEPICNVILMPLHDRMWERIRARVEARQANSAAHPDAAVIHGT